MTMSEAQKKFGLTDRETEVAALLGLGLTRKTIAQQLGIAVSTVDDHLAALRRKVIAESTWKLAFVLFQYSPRKHRA
jgi:DNA-binding CsgD family transcriptional regulator